MLKCCCCHIYNTDYFILISRLISQKQKYISYETNKKICSIQKNSEFRILFGILSYLQKKKQTTIDKSLKETRAGVDANQHTNLSPTIPYICERDLCERVDNPRRLEGAGRRHGGNPRAPLGNPRRARRWEHDHWRPRGQRWTGYLFSKIFSSSSLLFLLFLSFFLVFL